MIAARTNAAIAATLATVFTFAFVALTMPVSAIAGAGVLA